MKQFVPMPNTDRDLFSVLSKSDEVILCGGDSLVLPTIHALKKHNIIPSCICNYPANKSESRDIQGIAVISLLKARKLFPKATVIITEQPKHIDTFFSKLVAMGWTKIHDCAYLLSSFEYNSNSFSSGMYWLHFYLDKYFYDYFFKYYPDRFIVPSIDIVITEKCSLKCRDCANLMQYYTTPQHVDYDKLFISLDTIMESVDHVLEFRVLGGETFMNRNAHHYIQRLRKYANYTRIVIFSNGTIVPRMETLWSFAFEDTYFHISNYGSLSPKIDAMSKLFDSHEVMYEIDTMKGWHDCAVIAKRNRSSSELERIYTQCCVNKALTLLHSRLYPCPFSANATNLGALPFFQQDSIKINGLINQQKIQAWIFNILRMRKFISACDYCPGRPLGELPLPIAIQTPTSLPYDTFFRKDT